MKILKALISIVFVLQFVAVNGQKTEHELNGIYVGSNWRMFMRYSILEINDSVAFLEHIHHFGDYYYPGLFNDSDFTEPLSRPRIKLHKIVVNNQIYLIDRKNNKKNKLELNSRNEIRIKDIQLNLRLHKVDSVPEKYNKYRKLALYQLCNDFPLCIIKRYNFKDEKAEIYLHKKIDTQQIYSRALLMDYESYLRYINIILNGYYEEYKKSDLEKK